ncbi:MAG: hypothetical protein KF741_08210 [Ferruginibacter sp.]|nr:hypothetical protein [Bacteroidota bacterium]MBX2919220.1 hypothetical protein [Ferruginibacter sp.]
MYLYFFLFCFISCKETSKSKIIPGAYSPKVTEAKFNVIAYDSIKYTNPINNLRKKRAGSPLIVLSKNNIQKAGKSKNVKVGNPKVIVPGTDSFITPKKIAVTEHPEYAGLPEVFPVSEMTYKIPNPYSFASFGKLQGLKHSIVTALLEDNIGNIWICTASGVTKYDGKSFTNYTTVQGLVNNDVRSVLQDKSGNIWFGTLGGGVSKYDGYSFTNFTDRDGLCNNWVVSITEDKSGNIWFGTWNGITKYDGKIFTNFSRREGLINNYVQTIITDQTGNIWIGTRGGIAKYDGKSFTNFTENEGLKKNYTYTILEDKSGALWFGSEGGGISIYKDSTFTYLTENEGLINNEVYALTQDREGNIWIGTHHGLSKYDGNNFTNFTEKQGLSSDNIYCLFQDKANNLWIGTAGGGVLKLNHESFSHITETEGLAKRYVFSVYEDKEANLWIGTWRGGVYVYNGHTFKIYTTKQGLPNNDIRKICRDRYGNLWFATYRGVAKFDGNYFAYLDKSNGLADDDVNTIVEDVSGNIWIGTENGVSKYDGKTLINYFSNRIDFKVYCITQDRTGNIWFGSNVGIYKYDGKIFSQLTNTDVSLTISQCSIEEDKEGNIWIGTEKGAFRYDGHFIIHFTQQEGLIYNEITSIYVDSNGNIWFGTSFGLSKLPAKKLTHLSKRIHLKRFYKGEVFFRNYGYTDNFLGIGCSRNAIIESHDHRIWVGTNGGITSFNPLKHTDDFNAPSVQIKAIKVANKNIDWLNLLQKTDTSIRLDDVTNLVNFKFDKVSRWYGLPENLSLKHNNNYISFDYVGISMNQPQNVKYKYELVGLAGSQSDITNHTTATFGNLSPGNYTFKVKAMNSSGYWSNEVKYNFNIRSPWWKTWWFNTLVVLLAVCLIFFITRFFYLYKLHQQKAIIETQLAIQYERQRISSDLHDEIGSTLSSINIYSGLAKKEPNNPFYIDSINQNVNEVMNKLDDLVWSIKPTGDSLGKITERLNGYAQATAHLKGIEFTFSMNHQLYERQLNTDTKHHLYMVTKELINNAIKHSGCNQILVEVSSKNNNLTVTVNDNGNGFDIETAQKERNGLKNIRERVKQMKAKLEIKSKINKGTEIKIEIPT